MSAKKRKRSKAAKVQGTRAKVQAPKRHKQLSRAKRAKLAKTYSQDSAGRYHDGFGRFVPAAKVRKSEAGRKSAETRRENVRQAEAFEREERAAIQSEAVWERFQEVTPPTLTDRAEYHPEVARAAEIARKRLIVEKEQQDIRALERDRPVVLETRKDRIRRRLAEHSESLADVEAEIRRLYDQDEAEGYSLRELYTLHMSPELIAS